jgi:IS6 family transposase
VEVLVPRRRQAWPLIDFMLLDRRNTCAAYRFLGKALKMMRNWPPHSITTDKLGSYPKAIRRLQREGKLPQDTKHRTSKNLNNIIEADHGGLKRVIRPTRGFQTMRTASATIKGFEVMRMIRRCHLPPLQAQGRRRNSIHQQAVRCCCLMCNIGKSELRVPQLMQQSRVKSSCGCTRQADGLLTKSYLPRTSMS